MLTINLTIVDSTDDRPLEGAEVQVSPLAVPRWVQTTADLPDGPTKPHKPQLFMLAGLNDAAGPSPASATADGQGRISLSFDMGPSFAQAQTATFDSSPPTDVVLAARYRVTYANFTRDALVPLPLMSIDSPRLVKEESGVIDSVIVVDLGFAIVGHVTDEAATVWATTTGDLADQTLEVTATPEGGGAAVTARLALLDAEEDIGVAILTGLQAGTTYRYSVQLEPGSSAELTSGHFTTDDPSKRDLRFAFASCNRIDPLGMERWRRLAREPDLDAVFMVGDQIYEYGLRGETRQQWRDAYAKRYRYFWQSTEVRNSLRNQATYMILDDHDVKDDLGTVEIADPGRRDAAMEAYRLFQQSHGPADMGSKAHYSVRRGPAAFFVLDGRTQRVAPPPDALAENEDAHKIWTNRPSSTILGSEQIADLQAWSVSPEVQDADLAFIVAPIPLAFIDVPALLEMIDDIEEAAGEVGGFIGGLVGGAIGGIYGPVGGVIGKKFGEELGEFGGEALADYIIDREEPLTGHDIADLWNWQPHQPDLTRVLDIAFDIANDVNHPQGQQPRPKAVFILSGDVHAGGIHVIHSNRGRHLRNPTILQVTSSAIANEPPPSTIWDLVEHLQPGTSWVSVAADMALGTGLGNERARIELDSELDGVFTAVNVDFMPARNYGLFDVRHIGGRRYQFQVGVHGRDRQLFQLFEYNLDDGVVQPRDLLGSVSAAEGRVTMFRTHRRGSGFGAGANQLDVEAVVRIAGWRGWSFGIPLRSGPDLSANEEMVDICQRAVMEDIPLRVEFLRTGPKAGTVLRVSMTN